MPPQARFDIIGENIHTTRVVLRSGRHVVAEGDDEWLVFTDVDGVARRLPSPVGTARPMSMPPDG